MPGSQTVRALNLGETGENLSDLYVMLWKQLDVLLGDGKWFDIAPSPPADLKHGADQALQALHATISDRKLLNAIRADYVRVQELTMHPDAAPKTEIESLNDYLRDEALRFTEAAYSPESRG
jgi:hypothetical protein